MKVSRGKIILFRRTVWRYYRAHGRSMPWRDTINPYRIVVSEIMLQQTQVERVMKKYSLFIKAFPSFRALKKVSLARVLAAWQGLGYNRRALALKKIADAVVICHKGILPRDPAILQHMPGIGQSTAGAVAAFAFNKPSVFIETNIRRVFLYFFFPKRQHVSDNDIMPLVEAALDRANPREWYFALMDYGAMLGTRKKENPNQKSAHYRTQPKFEGSRRQLRGALVRLLLTRGSHDPSEAAHTLSRPLSQVRGALRSLVREGLVESRASIFSIPRTP